MITHEQDKVTPFYEGVYLFDLNQAEAIPLAFRSARGGEAPPDLLSLIGLSAREWYAVADKLYSDALYLEAGGGAVILPVTGSIGRLAVVVKTALSPAAFAYLVQNAGQGDIYADAQLCTLPPKLNAQERVMAESAVRTVADLRFLIDSCMQARDVYSAQTCIKEAACLMGVSLMPQEKAEAAPMKEQGILPGMQYCGQVLFACILTMLSVMRNEAHGRSGWLYATPCRDGYVLQAFTRCAEDTELGGLALLRGLLEDGGAAVGAHTYTASLKPPRQYAYMSRKITDPHKPLCACCQCLDARCTSCMALQWAVLPYVCDAALLGIKAEPMFKE